MDTKKVKYPATEATDPKVLEQLGVGAQIMTQAGREEIIDKEAPSFGDAMLKELGLQSPTERKADAEFQLELMARQPPADVGTTQVQVRSLRDSPTNPRKRIGNIDDLIASIKKVGIRNAPTVRQVDGELGYEVVVGHQRVAAAKELGIREIYVTILPLTDNDVLEIQATEQIQRVDLHEMEEAEHYGRMVKAGYSTDTIGHRIGKSKGHVAGRIKLLSLCPAARAAFLEELFHPSVGIPLARIYPEDIQAKALHGMLKIPTARAQIEYLQKEFSQNLKGAPFNLKDDTLVENVPACTVCPFNANNMEPTIFGDFEKGLERQGLCLNTPCYGVKCRAQTALTIAKAKEAGAEVMSVADAKTVLKPDGTLQYKAEYVTVDGMIQADPKKRTWGQLLDGLDPELKPKLVITQDPAHPGKTVSLFARKEAFKAARGMNLKWANSELPAAKDSVSPEEKAEKKAEREKQRAASARQDAILKVTQLTIPRLVKGWAKKAGLPEMRLVAAQAFANRKTFREEDQEVALSGFEIPGAKNGAVPTDAAVGKWIEKEATLHELIGLTLVMMKYEIWINTDDQFVDEFADLAAESGADLKAGLRAQTTDAALAANEKKAKK